MRLGLGLTLMGLLAGPSTPARPVEATPIVYKATLQPSRGGWADLRHTLDASTLGDPDACDAEPEWTYHEDLSSPKVGYDHTVVQNDVVPELLKNCVSNDVYEARPVFDVSALKQYPLAKGTRVRARLTYREERMVEGEPPRGSQGITCVKQTHIAASEGLKFQGLFVKGGEVFRTPVGHSGPPLNSDPWDLGDVVEGWINGSIANHGVILSGFDEGVGRQDDNACWSLLSGIQLEVQVIWNDGRPELSVERVAVKDKTGADGCVSGSVAVTASVLNTSDVPTAYQLLLRVDGKPVENVYTSVGGNERDTVPFSTVDLTAGEHVLVVQADPDNEKAETDEGNNLRTANVTCARGAAPKPEPKPADLQVSKVEVLDPANKAGCVAGKANGVHVVIKNAGDIEVGAIITIQLSVDGKPAQTVTMGGIGAPPSDVKDAYFSNVDLSKGAHTVQVTVNSDGKVTEADKTNNTSPSQAVTCAES